MQRSRSANRKPLPKKTSKIAQVVRKQPGGKDLVSKVGPRGPLKLASTNFGSARKSHLITEDEYIAEVNGSVAFACTSYPINIGQAATFPWGSKIAALYEKYTFQTLEFYYRRQVSEYATNGQTGKVMLSADYDASDAPPTTKQQVEDTEPHVDGMPCVETLVLRLSQRELKRTDALYVRSTTQLINTDIKTYDVGNLFVSTSGNANTNVIGELRVRYRCLVSVPVLSTPISYFPGSSLLMITTPAGETAAASTVYTAMFHIAGSPHPVVVANGIGALVIPSSGSGLITLLNGEYIITASCQSSNTTMAVTANYISLGQSSTAATDVLVVSPVGTENTANIVAPALCCVASLGPYYWNTAFDGNILSVQVAATYAGGACVNNMFLQIVLL
jgi:hypothetical protein